MNNDHVVTSAMKFINKKLFSGTICLVQLKLSFEIIVVFIYPTFHIWRWSMVMDDVMMVNEIQ